MRGKHGLFRGGFLNLRNIPAYAGKTDMIKYYHMSTTEHPRVCGENAAGTLRLPNFNGTSPRMRGKQPINSCEQHTRRNIPAYAGKTC